MTTCAALKIRIIDEKSIIDDSGRGLETLLETPVRVNKKNNETTEEYIPRKHFYIFIFLVIHPINYE